MAWECAHCGLMYEDAVKKHPFGLCKNCYFTPDIAHKFRHPGETKTEEPSSGRGYGPTQSTYQVHGCPSGPPGVAGPPGNTDPTGPCGTDPSSDCSLMTNTSGHQIAFADIGPVDPNPYSDMPYAEDTNRRSTFIEIRPGAAQIARWLSEMSCISLGMLFHQVHSLNPELFNEALNDFLVDVGATEMNIPNITPTSEPQNKSLMDAADSELNDRFNKSGAETYRWPAANPPTTNMPARKPDINQVATDIFTLKKTTLKIFLHLNLDLPPALLEIKKEVELQDQMKKLQLICGGEISHADGSKTTGLGFKQELARMTEEQRIEKARAEMDKPVE